MRTEQRAQRVAVAAGNRSGDLARLASDAGSLRDELRAAETDEPIRSYKISLRQRLIAKELQGRVVDFKILVRDSEVCPYTERTPDGGLDVDGLRHEVGPVDRIERRGPVRILRAAHDEPLERELRGLPSGLRLHEVLLRCRGLRLRLHDVDRRHGADLHARLVVLDAPVRKVERLLCHVY